MKERNTENTKIDIQNVDKEIDREIKKKRRFYNWKQRKKGIERLTLELDKDREIEREKIKKKNLMFGLREREREGKENNNRDIQNVNMQIERCREIINLIF